MVERSVEAREISQFDSDLFHAGELCLDRDSGDN